MSRDDDDTPIETPLPQRVTHRRYDYRCAAHEPLTARVAVIDGRTEQILSVVTRLEERAYTTAGITGRLDGRGSGAGMAASLGLKILAVTIAAGAGIGTVIGAVAAIVRLAQ